MKTSSRRPAWALPVIAWSAFVVAAVAVGMYAEPPFAREMRAGGRVAPRLPAPATDLRVLLYQLGIGSVTWFAAAASLPFLIWGARQIDFDQHRNRAIAIVVAVLMALVLAIASVDYL